MNEELITEDCIKLCKRYSNKDLRKALQYTDDIEKVKQILRLIYEFNWSWVDIDEYYQLKEVNK